MSEKEMVRGFKKKTITRMGTAKLTESGNF